MSGCQCGGQVECEGRIEVFVKIQKRKKTGVGSGRGWGVRVGCQGGGVSGWGGQDRCDRRIEVFVTIKKEISGGGGFRGGVGGVRFL